MKQVNILVHCCPNGNEPRAFASVPNEYMSQVASSHTEDDIIKYLFKMLEVEHIL